MKLEVQINLTDSGKNNNNGCLERLGLSCQHATLVATDIRKSLPILDRKVIYYMETAFENVNWNPTPLSSETKRSIHI